MALGPFAALRSWIDRRRAIRRRWKTDARQLIEKGEPTAYYEAQRLAARARASGDRHEFVHWAKVASEVARLSAQAGMDLGVVEAIVAEEMGRRR